MEQVKFMPVLEGIREDTVLVLNQNYKIPYLNTFHPVTDKITLLFWLRAGKSIFDF